MEDPHPRLIATICFFLVVFVAAELSFGITNLVISIESANAKNECGSAVWYSVLFLGIAHLIVGIAMIIRETTKWFSCNNFKSYLDIIATLLIYIWAFIAYFSLSTECANFYEDNYPKLNTTLLANVVLFIIYASFVIIIEVSLCLWVECVDFCTCDQAEDSRDANVA